MLSVLMIFLLIFQYFNGIVDIHSYDDRILITASERLFIMKELGKIIAKNRKANKMKQGELAKKLEGYDIFVKQNTVSAWESGSTQPSARQLLAICEILDIYDVYTEFIGQNCIFRKNCASVPEERSAIPLQTEQSSAG